MKVGAIDLNGCSGKSRRRNRKGDGRALILKENVEDLQSTGRRTRHAKLDKQGRKGLREKEADSPLKPKQVNVGTGSCSHISEDQLICTVIRNEAQALITTVIWVVFILW